MQITEEVLGTIGELRVFNSNSCVWCGQTAVFGVGLDSANTLKSRKSGVAIFCQIDPHRLREL